MITFMKNSVRGKTIGIKSRSAVAWGQGEEEGLPAKGHDRTFWSDGHALYLDCAGS